MPCTDSVAKLQQYNENGPKCCRNGSSRPAAPVSHCDEIPTSAEIRNRRTARAGPAQARPAMLAANYVEAGFHEADSRGVP